MHQHTHTHTQHESETLLKASVKVSNNSSCSRWRSHRDGIFLSPICCRFIKTVGKLRGTHSSFRQDFDPSSAGELVAAEVVPYHPPATPPSFLDTGFLSEVVFFFSFLFFYTAPVCCFTLISCEYSELQHTYPQSIILLNINFCVCYLQPPSTPCLNVREHSVCFF